MKKRILSIILVLCMVMSFMPVLSVAADDTPKLVVSTETAAPGDEVTLAVSTENNPGVGVLTLGIDYDKTKLELIGFENAGFTGWAVKTSAVWVGDEDSTFNGVILKLKFKVLDTATDGLASVSLKCGEGDAYNFSEEPIDFTVVGGGINVKAAQTEMPKLVVSTETASPGEDVTLTVSTENNPGVGVLTLGIDYDKTKLELIGFENAGFTGWAVKTNAVWVGDEDSTFNGIILKLKFKVLDSATEGMTNVSLKCEDGDAYNFNEDPISFEIVAGGVEIKNETHTHSYTSQVTEPTCTEKGYTTYTCSCGDSYVDDYVAALGHKTEIKNAKDATCTEAGYTGDEVCKTCGKTVNAGSVIAALGHKTEIKNAKEASCTEAGYTGDEVCTVCGKTVKTGTVIAVLGHKTEIKNAKDATCTEAGYTGDEVCTVCGKTVKTGSVIAALGHKTEIKNAKDATCSEAGYTGDEVCTVCGKTVKTGSVIAAIGHKTEIKNAKAASCTEAGYTGDEVCKTCGKTVNAGSVIAALGHKTEIKNAKAASCTEAGYTGDEICTVCGKTVKTGNVIAALGHSFSDGKCTKCGAADPIDNPVVKENPFVDVKENHYFYDAVLWAYYNNPQITNGMDATHFAPNAVCTRAQTVTFLWRAMGCPDVTNVKNPFTDVKEGAYYYKAVLWAVKNGITNGTSATTFSPNAKVTRAQTVTFLFRAAKGTPVLENNPFVDVKTNQYYTDAVLWAVKNGITNGTSASTFAPNASCTRGQIVTFLYRFMG